MSFEIYEYPNEVKYTFKNNLCTKRADIKTKNILV